MEANNATCSVLIDWAAVPREGILEWVEKVPQDPGQDCVVEQAH